MSFPADFLDELRSRIRISEVIGRKLKLIKRGREFIALCPFHNDSKPSLSVVDEKNFYHCFACGAHGDIIKFTMETEGLNFIESVDKLANLAGLEVPKQDPIERAKEARRRTLREVVEEVTTYFEEFLRKAPTKAGLDYLKERGLSDRTIKSFRLGLAPANSKTFRVNMQDRGIEEKLLEEAGLIKKSAASSSTYDYFRGRLIFPISDRRGQIIGFGGRALNNQEPKYLNSPETSLFQKGQILYQGQMTREIAHKTDQVIVVEGYMDVISLAEVGINNAVAPLGTALTERQIRELWKFSTEPIICFDGDSAGMRAAVRASDRLLPILEPGLSARFASLPPGEDPDDIVRRGGANKFRELLEASTGLSDFFWEMEKSNGSLDTPEKQAAFFKRIRKRVGEIKNQTVREAYKDSIEANINNFRASMRAVKSGMDAPYNGYSRSNSYKPIRSSISNKAARVNITQTMERRQKQAILAAFLMHPSLVEDFGEALGYLELGDPFLDKLRLDILDIYADEGLINSQYLKKRLFERGYTDNFDGVLEDKALAHIAFAGPGVAVQKARDGVRELLSRIGKYQLEEQIALATNAVMDDLNEVNWNRLSSLRAALVSVNGGSNLEDPV